MALLGNGRVLSITAFVVIGLGVGHWLGGPDPEDRTVLALSTASRHPGIALAITTTNFPEEKLATGAVLLYLLVSAIVVPPYLKCWGPRRGRPLSPKEEHRVKGQAR
jgi:BASS family bile acid:Na+ symporter